MYVPVQRQGHQTTRDDWANYRPISVSPAEFQYKILTKAVQIAVAKEIHHVVSPSQYGFQKGKYIGEAIALAQLTASYCSCHASPGLLHLHDGEKAYDRVQHGWIHAVLERMGFPESFRKLIYVTLSGLTSRVKVNGVLGTPFRLLNSVKQGCPLAPYLYILSVQPLLDTLDASCTFRGVIIPGRLGDRSAPFEVRVAAYADDLAIYMRDYYMI